jgi:hypothetical protein
MKNIQEAKDPDLRACSAAMQRAAQAARKTAIQTGTNLIIVKDGKLTRISAQALRELAVGSDFQISSIT